MSHVEEDLKYADTHEWVRMDDEATATVGISDHAQHLLGELVFVELPEVGTEIEAGEEVGVVESVKAASDVYSPVSGTIIEINDVLERTPELVNTEPYGDGWLYRIKINDSTEVDSLMSADQYQASVEEEEEPE
ncbi:MAG: glycine cleavage system protein [Gammaproteobacteria bacterium]|jgi:glycine cleavage system H protein|nr:glycine cleavage system protein [Gammaproteobacteria bacterium]